MYTIRNARVHVYTRVHLYLLWYTKDTKDTKDSLCGGVDWSKIIKNERKFILEVSTVAINFRKKPIKTLLNAFELRSTRTLPQKTPCVQAPR